MTLSHIRLENFRSYAENEFDFSPEVTVISGRNGAGKTNILEAIYVLLQGKSFRDSDEQLIRHDADWWKIQGLLEGSERELRYELGQPSQKQLYVDGALKGRFTYKQQIPVVLFEPDDLLLLHGSPSLRRAYLDEMISLLIPTYRATLARYERALLQRNNLLKRGGSVATLKDTIFVWDVALSEYGAEIQQERQQVIAALNARLSDDYSQLATTISTLETAYQSSSNGSSQSLAKLLSHSLEKDLARGFTGVGPHRDDVSFTLNGKDAKITASRGEVRTIVLSLKHAELALIQEMTGRSPLFLLDDVLSELDAERQKSLLDHTKGIQKIITTTHVLPTKKFTIIKL